MEAELTPTVADDAPALAGAIVIHAQKLCETADHLWRVLSKVSIPTEPLTDDRQQHKVTFDTESMARVYIYQSIYDLAQSEVADRLANRPSLLKGLGLSKVRLNRISPTHGSSSVSKPRRRSTPLHEELHLKHAITTLSRTHWFLSSRRKLIPTKRTSKHCLAHTCASTAARSSNSPEGMASASSTQQSRQQDLRGRTDPRSVRHCLSHARQCAFRRRSRLVPR